MQLDRTSIAVRERSGGEWLDLALRVVSKQGPALALYFLLGAAPLVVVNGLLLGPEAFAGLRRYGPERFLVLSGLLTYLSASLAGAPATIYLGQAMFFEPTDPKTVLTRYLRSLPQLVYFLGLWRGLIPAWLLTWGLGADGEIASLAGGFFWIGLLAVGQRLSRPYTPEVIALERNPWRSSRPDGSTTARRSRDLHRGSADSIGSATWARYFAAAILVVVFWQSGRFLAAAATGVWEFNGWMYLVGWQASLWAAALFETVARFLGYLDLRIRREGWEVELRLRAEAQRLEGVAA